MAAKLVLAASALAALLAVVSAARPTSYQTVVPIAYRSILNTSDPSPSGPWVFGQAVNKHYKPIFTVDASGNPTSDFLISNNPDFTAIIPVGKKLFVLNHFESPRPGSSYITEVTQGSDGTLTAVSTRPVDWSSVHGLWIPCAGSRTPWMTFMSGEEYEPDARPFSEAKTLSQLKTKMGGPWGDVEGFMAYWDIYKAQITYENVMKYFNPYRYGHIAETRVSSTGATSVHKWYTLGRAAWELAMVMPDRKTVYGTDDGTNVGFYKFVADKAGDLSQGRIYAAKMTQTSADNGGSFTVSWVQLGYGKDADLKKMAEAVKFSHIFQTAPYSATKGCPAGFKSINQDDVGAECLKLRNGMATAAAFLETRRYAAYLGATVEWSKWEGLTFDAKRMQLYTAMSDVRYGMEDNKRRGGADTRYDRGGPNHIRLPYNPCGCVYTMPVDSKYSVTSMTPLLCGKPIPADADGNQCDLNGISNPDNVWVADDIDTLMIAEDSGLHYNNMLWAYDLKTGKMDRMLTVQPDAEVGHVSYYKNIGAGFNYLMADNQHPINGAPATMGYFTWPSSATTGTVDVDFESISVPKGEEGDVIRGTTKMTVTRP